MSNKDRFYWKDMEPLEDDDKFFSDLCALIDKHSDDPEERLRYLCGLEDFKEGWMDNWGVSQTLWGELIDEPWADQLTFVCQECANRVTGVDNLYFKTEYTWGAETEEEGHELAGCPECGVAGRMNLIME